MNTWLSGTAIAAVLLLVSTESAFSEESERSGLWGGVDIGAGRVSRTAGAFEDEDTNVYLGFKLGYVVHPQALVGVEFSGWNQEATDWDDPTKGEGLMQVFAIGRFYPVRDLNLFAKVGGGWARQWAQGARGETNSLDGWGTTLGVGYDFPIGDGFAVTPFLNYAFGETGDMRYQSITLGTGFTFY
jgi:hypothetical protein